MSPSHSTESEEFGIENGDAGVSRLRSAWAPRRQAKQRSKARARRRTTVAGTKNGIHMRRNKRQGW
jgi:hypothetical protein